MPLALVRSTSSRRPSRRDWASRICACWQRSVEAIIETGQLLISAKAALAHGQFEEMVDADLPFGLRTVQRLMAIGADPRVAKATRESLLPPCWTTVYELTTLDDSEFSARIKDGTINPEMERADLLAFKTAGRRDERLAEMRELADNPLRLPQGPFAAGIVDPPWENEDAPIGFSKRHYRSHYPTMTPAEIAALPVGQIFGRKAFIALWATRHIVAIGAHAEVLRAWGFQPNTVITWDKQWIGLGNGYVRDRTEHLVFATRGKPAVPGPKLRPDSLFAERRSAKHSQKPFWAHKQIERWFPDMSYVELFARNVKGESPRKGWTAWGNEVNT